MKALWRCVSSLMGDSMSRELRLVRALDPSGLRRYLRSIDALWQGIWRQCLVRDLESILSVEVGREVSLTFLRFGMRQS